MFTANCNTIRRVEGIGLLFLIERWCLSICISSKILNFSVCTNLLQRQNNVTYLPALNISCDAEKTKRRLHVEYLSRSMELHAIHRFQVSLIPISAFFMYFRAVFLPIISMDCYSAVSRRENTYRTVLGV